VTEISSLLMETYSSSFASPEIEEARASLFGLSCARDARNDTLIVEGSYFPLGPVSFGGK